MFWIIHGDRVFPFSLSFFYRVWHCVSFSNWFITIPLLRYPLVQKRSNGYMQYVILPNLLSNDRFVPFLDISPVTSNPWYQNAVPFLFLYNYGNNDTTERISTRVTFFPSMNSLDSTLRSHHRELEMHMTSLLLCLTCFTWINMVLSHFPPFLVWGKNNLRVDFFYIFSSYDTTHPSNGTSKFSHTPPPSPCRDSIFLTDEE